MPPGTSLLWLDTSALDARVQTIPRVATVDVRRSFPHTVTVTVTEREPVAAVPLGTGVALVDGTGFAYRTMPAPPAGIPRLVLAGAERGAVGPDDRGRRPRPRGPAGRPARSRITELRAASPYDVSFCLDAGRTVRWGADADDARKAAVLGPLLSRPGSTYDVSTPDLPGRLLAAPRSPGRPGGPGRLGRGDTGGVWSRRAEGCLARTAGS